MSLFETLLGGSCLTPGSGVAIYLPNNYGYVILTGIGSMFMLTWKAIQVGKVRKQFKIFYPKMYSEDNDLFNCYQRAHQNTLEVYPTFLTMLFVGGLEMPVWSSLAGLIFILGRIRYAQGYYTGDPKKRMQGAFYVAGLLMLLGASTKFAYRLITN